MADGIAAFPVTYYDEPEVLREAAAALAAAEERAQAAEQSNAELTALGIDRELALEDSRAQVRELREALGEISNTATALPHARRLDRDAMRSIARAVLARSAGRAET